jgi:thiol:disulfide interchange protein DsbG
VKINRLLTTSLLMAALALGACSKSEPPATATAVKREASLEVLATQAKGFTVGAMMSANTVYVLFDTQCAHCGHLWQASMALQKKVKFVWIPVGMISATSRAQGAAILTASDPAALMTEHEASLLAGKGGISASASLTPEMEQAIQKNTQLLNDFGAEAVPFVVARNAKTGQMVSQAGALSTAALADFLGVEQP